MERIEDLGNIKIYQDDSKFKFGTDALLLAKYVNVKKGNRVLDIGTGTGIITFSIYKPLASFVGIDIQEDMISLANKSKALNSLENIDFIHCDLKEYCEKHSFDCLVSNPPYEPLGSGFINENEKISRYEYKATLEDIVECAKNNGKPNSRFYMIYKANRLFELCVVLNRHGFSLKEIVPLQKNENTAPRLIMIKAVKNGKSDTKWLAPIYLNSLNNLNKEEEV